MSAGYVSPTGISVLYEPPHANPVVEYVLWSRPVLGLEAEEFVASYSSMVFRDTHIALGPSKAPKAVGNAPAMRQIIRRRKRYLGFPFGH
jgi:hypothetical protein